MDAAALQALIDRRQIEDVLLRYARGIDRRDPELAKSCYHPDAIDEHGSFDGDGRAFIDFTMPRIGRMPVTNHLLTNIWIEVSGETAVSEAYFIGFHRLPEGGDWGEGDLIIVGRYVDRFEKRAGEWKIAHRRVIYDQMRVDPASDQWSGPLFKGCLRRPANAPDDFVYQRWAELRR